MMAHYMFSRRNEENFNLLVENNVFATVKGWFMFIYMYTEKGFLKNMSLAVW